MHALQLDYHEGPATFRGGTVLLLAGILLAALAGLEYSAVHEKVMRWEAKVAELRKTARRGASETPQNPRETEAAAQELKAAYAAYQRLSLPWSTLYGALESSRISGVALLALEPDAGKSTIKLSAEAKSDADMINYVQQLQKASVFADVTLTSHQTKQGDSSRALRFVVAATWIRQP